MRVLLTGSREWNDNPAVFKALYDLKFQYGPFTLVHGNAKDGVDALGKMWATFAPSIIEEPHDADWSQGRSAGHKRNQLMVDLGADLCLAFPTICKGDKKNCPKKLHYSHGTAGCMKAAEKAGIPVQNHGPDLTDPWSDATVKTTQEQW